MITEKKFKTYNFFEQIDKFVEYTKELKNISADLLNKATAFFNLIKKADLKQYRKIDADKSFIFINETDFGLELFLFNQPENRIVFHFDNNETTLLFYEQKKIQDGLFGQGVADSCDYLLKHLQSV
ncbi:hypothetical protein J4479_01275 [Candidatus Woesearchaeota archaeon]|nr:hypothetical protein [Candidatus Woesearchaeota archaeon]